MGRGDLEQVGKGIVETGEGDFVLGVDLLADDNLVDIVQLVPIIVGCVCIPVKRFGFGVTEDCWVECFCCEGRVLVKEVGSVDVSMVREEGAAKSIEVGHYRWG